MNEETIDYRLDQIEKKLDSLTDILLQTQAQEMRIATLEKSVKEMYEKSEKNLSRWLNPLLSAAISGIVAFIFVKVGIK